MNMAAVYGAKAIDNAPNDLRGGMDIFFCYYRELRENYWRKLELRKPELLLLSMSLVKWRALKRELPN